MCDLPKVMRLSLEILSFALFFNSSVMNDGRPAHVFLNYWTTLSMRVLTDGKFQQVSTIAHSRMESCVVMRDFLPRGSFWIVTQNTGQLVAPFTRTVPKKDKPGSFNSGNARRVAISFWITLVLWMRLGHFLQISATEFRWIYFPCPQKRF